MKSLPLSVAPSTAPNAEDIRRCTAVLEAIIEDRGLIAALPDEERRALLIAAGRVSRPARLETVRLAKAHREHRRVQQQSHDREAKASTQIRSGRLAAVFEAPALLPEASRPTEARVLQKPRACYVCKTEFNQLHFFYDAMCPPCAELNYAKRFQTARLDGRVALITGARLKIGYQAALMMLRAGARVIVTTRFPRDAAARYARETDAAEWTGRLQIHGLDLRHAPSVELFSRHLVERFDRLDLLINNAAQTVRRPPGFYAHLQELETQPFASVPRSLQPLLAEHEDFKTLLGAGFPKALGEGMGPEALEKIVPGLGLVAAASLSQIPHPEDPEGLQPLLFPPGRSDADLQQVDLRMMNSWRMTMADVPTPELLEVQLVNAVAPFILCSKLKPLMLRQPTHDRHIVNVSAMEGKFSRGTKTDKHPHTNMAKAALNMMTLTSASDYARDGIFMNAVDTGWVTDEDPAAHATRKREELDFQPPLDIVDGAARICDPFFSGLLTGEHVWGKFLKDYRLTDW